MKVGTKTKHYWRKFYNYVRYDFKEMAFPSALPDPPGSEPIRKFTWADHVFVWKLAIKVYLKSWKTHDIDIDDEYELMKNPDKIKSDKMTSEEQKKPEPREMSAMEDLAVAAKAGSEHIRPALQRIYMTKASAYRDALKSFVEGYRDGLTETLNSEKNTDDMKPDSDSLTETLNSEKNTSDMKPDSTTTIFKQDVFMGQNKKETKACDVKQANSSNDSQEPRASRA